MRNKSIGIFDSGYGGLTVFREIHQLLPSYDYIYLGDNARMPYGNHSFSKIYEDTRECVFKLFDLGCDLVILACNTASARALRTIQQKDLPPGKKVLGVIRPTTESVGDFTKSLKVGILGTQGTVSSGSYQIEINKFFPEIQVFQQACPLWASLAEHNDLYSEAAASIIKKDIELLLQQSDQIDTVVLACTHYPILRPTIDRYMPNGIKTIEQGQLVAEKLENYLRRHRDFEQNLSKNGTVKFMTTGDPDDFNVQGSIFYGQEVSAELLEVK